MTKKSDQDPQSEGWANRLAFLDGITAENESIFKEDDEDDVLVPVPAEAPSSSRRRRPPRRLSAEARRLQARRQVSKTALKPPKKESPSAEARAFVKKRVDALRDAVLRKAMPGIAMELYREGRQRINELTSDSSEYEQQKARWALQAAIDALEISERYSDAADVLIFLARWALRVQPDYNESVRGFIDKARTYLDPKIDHKLLRDCDELELMYGAKNSRK